ncbi:MAG TPA: response regulator [Pyrinomonadaceae bacterium]|jgi:signal transduction histidine kinase|nr:response regulator [Pyrinomonadaceae bacterium]
MFRVLLVDDEPSIRLTMTEFLKRAGYAVAAAADFESASMLGNSSIDVAVVDINLTNRSGIELLRKINQDEPYIPVIMITGEPNLSTIPEIVRAGAYDFIAKPVVKDVLLKAVERAAEKKRLSDETRRLEAEIKQHAEELESRIAQRTAELVEAHDRLAHAEKIAALGRVSAQVAHEVRNPLAGLLLYSVHLKDKVSDKLPTGEVQLIDKIIDTINQLTRTTEQILNFARPVQLARRRVVLDSVIGDVLQLLKSQLSASGIEARLDLGDATQAGMLDEASMRAALLNLMLNAVQAMPEGGRLTVTCGTVDATLRLVISDSGSGMSEEQLARIYEPFNSTKSRGLGLGMPYARKVVEEHGGTITVDSKLGEGTRVTIELPAELPGNVQQ